MPLSPDALRLLHDLDLVALVQRVKETETQLIASLSMLRPGELPPFSSLVDVARIVMPGEGELQYGRDRITLAWAREMCGLAPYAETAWSIPGPALSEKEQKAMDYLWDRCRAPLKAEDDRER